VLEATHDLASQLGSMAEYFLTNLQCDQSSSSGWEDDLFQENHQQNRAANRFIRRDNTGWLISDLVASVSRSHGDSKHESLAQSVSREDFSRIASLGLELACSSATRPETQFVDAPPAR
jgi:hypothetical protein